MTNDTTPLPAMTRQDFADLYKSGVLGIARESQKVQVPQISVVLVNPHIHNHAK
jgi:hypothetical protein